MARKGAGERQRDEHWLLWGGAGLGAVGLGVSVLVMGTDGRIGFAAEVGGAVLMILYFFRRWLPPCADIYEHGYRAGWHDALEMPYPDEHPNVTPLRRR